MNTPGDDDASELRRYGIALERDIVSELKRSALFEVLDRPASSGTSDEESFRAIPNLVMRSEDQYLAFEIAVVNPGKLSGVAVQKAALAERLRQQLPEDTTLVLVIQISYIERNPELFHSFSEDDIDPESIDVRLRSSAKAALRKPGFDAVIFIATSLEHALTVRRESRRITYESSSLREAAECVLKTRRRPRTPSGSQELKTDSSIIQGSSEPYRVFLSHSVSAQERYLLIADELLPSKGGISSLNLELAKALRNYDREVCVALPHIPTDPEQQLANNLGIKLALPATQIPGVQGPPAFLSGIRYLEEQDFRPTVIVGHGRILGPYAYAIQHKYPSSARVHLVHMHAEELERAKELDGGEPRTRTAMERSALEVELAMSANVVAGVGPKLTAWITDQVVNEPLFAERGSQIISLVPGLRDWPQYQKHIPSEKRFLITARAEDFESKGIATAIRAVGQARLKRPNYPDTISLIIRGVPADHIRLKDLIDSTAASYGYQPILRPYTTNSNEIATDLRTSITVLMPSKTEGFGLSAYEAMAAGVPTLISRDSGLARLIRDVEGTVDWPDEALPPDDEDSWVDAILKVLDDPESSFRRAGALRDSIRQKDFWNSSILELEQALARVRDARMP